MEKEYCCDRFNEIIRDSGGFEMYEKDKEVHVGGCCGGGCFVLSDLKYCPFCGKEIVFK